MDTYLYFTMLPEALVASHLPPEAFGMYQAVGMHRRSSAESLFFEVDPGFDSSYFPMDELSSKCVPHADGSPRKSTYLAIYRVLEHLPISALKTLHLATDDGRVLALGRGEQPSDPEHPSLYLYQEYVPIQPLVTSSLHPRLFSEFITDRKHPVSVDKLVFCDMRLDDLAEDPNSGLGDNLPYRDMPHLRDCLNAVWKKGSKDVKVVERFLRRQVQFRMIRSGFYVGGGTELAFYPMPDREALETVHYDWWRSAQTTSMR